MNRPLKRGSSSSVSHPEPKRVKNECSQEINKMLECMGGPEKEKAKQSAKRLKSYLSNESNINQFVNITSNVEAIVKIFSRHAGNFGCEEHNSDLLHYSVSILANCCFTAQNTSNIIRKNSRSFWDLAIRIFENASTVIDIKISMCRLIGNMCTNKELALSWISSNTLIFDRIALLLESPDLRIVKQCLRIFTILSNSSLTRVIMLSNGGFYLGGLLSNKKVRNELMIILKILLKRHSKVLDRQLSSRGCSAELIDIFFDTNREHRKIIISLFSTTVCIREQMETDDFINKIIESELEEKTKMLSSFAQTAWGRAKLRTSGALDMLIDKLSESTDDEERLAIVSSFRHFVHDTAGMRHLSENVKFINTVIRDVNKYVEENRNECKPSIDLDFVRGLSNRLNELSTTDSYPTAARKSTGIRLHKDFYSMWAYETPQTSPRRNTSASPPYYSHHSPSYSFPSSNASSGASSPTNRVDDILNDNASDIELENPAESNEIKIRGMEKKIDKSIIDGELWLVTWQSQDDYNSQFLVRADVVDCVISYLRSTRHPEFRSYRILRRIATLRTLIYQLIDMQFHVRILTGLCASPCRMTKYAKPCRQCDSCAEHGREILREFACHVDNSYGDAHINDQFNSTDFLDRTKAAIAKIVLVKERIRLAKVPALNVLFDSLTHVLQSPDSFEEIGRITTYENGPTLASQIIGALSSLIHGQRIRKLCENDSWYFAPENGQGKCLIEKCENEMLTFVNNENNKIESAPMENVCENSEYFQAMFSSNFIEKEENIRTFQVDEEECPQDDFKVFLHLLSSCSSSCTAVTSAEQCANLLNLSDRYLCHSISKMLCANNGPLRTFLNGKTISVLLPIALSTNAHPTLLDTVFLTLVCFTSTDDVTKALATICDNSLMVETFINKLKIFLTGN